MTDPLLDRVSWMLKLEHRTRVTLLRWHGGKASLAGLLMMFTGSAASFETHIGLWIRPTLGGLGILAGCVLLAALTMEPDNSSPRLLSELAGLALAGMWDALMALAIVLSYIGSPNAWHLYWPWEALPVGAVTPYATVVYLSLTGMVWTVHARTVGEIRRDRRLAS